MRFTIVGSFPQQVDSNFPLDETVSGFSEACAEIGRRLAEVHQSVVLGAYGEETADQHVIRGIVEVAGGSQQSRPLIYMIEPETLGPAFQTLWQQHFSLITAHPRRLRGREASKVASVQEADAVVAIGGQRGTR
jgi:hypothetical protein